MKKWVWTAKQASKGTELFFAIFGISQPLWGPECQYNLPAKAWIHPWRHSKGNVIVSTEELSYTKGEVWLNHSFSDSHQDFPKVESCVIWRGWYRPRAIRKHSYFHCLLHLSSNVTGEKPKREEKPRQAHQSASWGVLWGRPSVGRRSYRRDI